jgi:hypothetical protein
MNVYRFDLEFHAANAVVEIVDGKGNWAYGDQTIIQHPNSNQGDNGVVIITAKTNNSEPTLVAQSADFKTIVTTHVITSVSSNAGDVTLKVTLFAGNFVLIKLGEDALLLQAPGTQTHTFKP